MVVVSVADRVTTLRRRSTQLNAYWLPVGSFHLSTLFDFALVACKCETHECENRSRCVYLELVLVSVIRSGFYDFSANFVQS